MGLDEKDPKDPTGQARLPYVVKLDPPEGRLIAVHADESDLVRAEVCFGQCEDALSFSLCCKPLQPLKQTSARTRRFSVADRVACAVEDATSDYSDWAAGEVLALNHDVEVPAGDFTPGDNGLATFPYLVMLETGTHVLVHRDDHWLVRDLALQAPGPRQSAAGACNLKRLEKRRAADGSGWELVDHQTRKVRLQGKAAFVSDDEDEDDEDGDDAT